MKTSRMLALPAIAAAALLALTGCFQLPPVGGTGEGGTTTGSGSEDLAGSTWTGGALGVEGETFATMEFTLHADGTVDISDWNDGEGGPFDSANDVWSGDPSNLSVTITDLRESSEEDVFDVTFTGTATEGAMSLAGDGPSGTWTLTATQG